MKRLLLVSVLFLIGKTVFGQKSIAQTNSELTQKKLFNSILFASTELNAQEKNNDAFENVDWEVLLNQEKGIVYIDFEALQGPFYTMHLKNNLGETIWKDATIYDLPYNTIYELDTRSFIKGEYTLELLRQNGSNALQAINID